jgi:hypothetical protein
MFGSLKTFTHDFAYVINIPIVQENNRLRNSVIAISLAATILHGYIEQQSTHGHGPRFEFPNPWSKSRVKTIDAGYEKAGDPFQKLLLGYRLVNKRRNYRFEFHQ